MHKASGTPLELNEIQLCYFSALIDGLRLINEKELELPGSINDKDFNANALIHYVRVKGDKIVALCYPNFKAGDECLPAPEPPFFPGEKKGSNERGKEGSIRESTKEETQINGPVNVEGKGEELRRTAIKKTFTCRWCSYERPNRKPCPRCGKKSNTWSSQRQISGFEEATDTGMTYIDVLLAIERGLISEIGWIAAHNGAGLSEAIRAFKTAIALVPE